MLGVVDEVLPGEEAALGVAGGQGLGNAGQDAGSLAGQHLVAIEIAAIGQHGEFLTRHHVPGLLPHRQQLGAVVADIGHLVRHDEMVLGLHRHLDVVADNAGALAAGGHGAGIRIGERDLLVGRGLHLLLHLLQRLHLPGAGPRSSP